MRSAARHPLAWFCCLIVAGALAACTRSDKVVPVVAQQAPMKPGDYLELNEKTPGQLFDARQSLVQGKITIYDYWSPYCPPCLRFKPFMKYLASARSDLAVRAINVNRPEVQGIDWDSPIMTSNNIHALPYYQIFNANGKLMLEGQPATFQVAIWLRQIPKRGSPR